MAVAPLSPPPSTGVALWVVEPLPSWPESLLPQQPTGPSASRAQVCNAPALTAGAVGCAGGEAVAVGVASGVIDGPGETAGVGLGAGGGGPDGAGVFVASAGVAVDWGVGTGVDVQAISRHAASTPLSLTAGIDFIVRPSRPVVHRPPGVARSYPARGANSSRASPHLESEAHDSEGDESDESEGDRSEDPEDQARSAA